MREYNLEDLKIFNLHMGGQSMAHGAAEQGVSDAITIYSARNGPYLSTGRGNLLCGRSVFCPDHGIRLVHWIGEGVYRRSNQVLN